MAAAWCLVVALVWLALGLCWPSLFQDPGAHGDQFGAVTSLFTGLAFALLIVELKEQREESKATRVSNAESAKQMKAQTAATERLASAIAERSVREALAQLAKNHLDRTPAPANSNLWGNEILVIRLKIEGLSGPPIAILDDGNQKVASARQNDPNHWQFHFDSDSAVEFIRECEEVPPEYLPREETPRVFVLCRSYSGIQVWYELIYEGDCKFLVEGPKAREGIQALPEAVKRVADEMSDYAR